jgi:exonuclease SbcC
VTARVEQLLGLDFDAFNRSVFLAQNRFAEFLQATAAQRDAVLKGVFGFDRLDRMAEVAKSKRDGLRGELAELERLRAEVEGDRLTLEETIPAREAIAQRLKVLDEAHQQAGKLEAAVEAAVRDLERGQRRGAELSDIAAQLPARERSRELLDRAESGTRLLDRAETALAAATEDFAAALRYEQDAVAETGGRDRLSQAARLAERIEAMGRRLASLTHLRDEGMARLDAAAAGRKDAEKELAALQKGNAAAVEKLAKAAAAMEEAEVALHFARHEAMALALRKELVEGESCPVCEQSVAVVPAIGKVAAIDRAEKKLAGARKAHEAAQAFRTEAAAALAGGASDLKARGAAIAAVQEQLDGTESELAGVTAEAATLTDQLRELIPADDPVADIERRIRALDEAAALVESKRAAETAARAAVDEIRHQQRRLAGELVQLATTVATLAGQLGGDLRPGAEATELAESLETLRKLWEEARLEVEREQEAARGRAAEASQRLEELREALEIPADLSITDARQHAAAEHGKLAERVETLTGRISRFTELEATSAATVARLQTYTTLADDLLPSRFLKFILDEERRALAALGSEHFERMTRERYRFTEDGEFNIIDLTSAETERKAESLSGGETFLASLSLALALAEMVSRTGGRLDAFFLDEGFGSLDPEHLDLAMEGIEALVGGNRLVAVVSHVAELRERVEDLVELSTDAITGDTVVVRA